MQGGGVIEVKVAKPSDGAACAAIYRPVVETTWISFETEPPDGDAMGRRIAALLPDFPWLVAEADGRVLGYVYGGAHKTRPAYRWSVDVTVYLDEAARGKGLGRRLYGVLFDLLRRQGFRSAFGGIALPNAASVALHEAMGFQRLGTFERVGYKFGGWRDVGWWRLGLDDSDAPPRDPIPFAQLRKEPAFSSWLG